MQKFDVKGNIESSKVTIDKFKKSKQIDCIARSNQSILIIKKKQVVTDNTNCKNIYVLI